MKVVERLKQQIDNKGMKYTWISQKTGIPVNRISSIFLGKRKLLADEFLLICKVAEIEVESFRNTA